MSITRIRRPHSTETTYDENTTPMTAAEQTYQRALDNLFYDPSLDQNKRVREFKPDTVARPTYQNILRSMKWNTKKIGKAHPITPYSQTRLTEIYDDFSTNPINWTADGLLLAERNTLHFQQSPKHQPTAMHVSRSQQSIITGVHLLNTSRALVATNQNVYYNNLELQKTYQHEQFNGIPAISFCQMQHPAIIGYAANSRSSISYFDSRAWEAHMKLSTKQATGGRASKIISNNKYLVATAFNSNPSESVVIWDIRKPNQELSIFTKHRASIKGMTFHPQQRNTIATSSGLDDPTIYVWNAQNGEIHNKVTTVAQITSLHWRSNQSLVATHGYSYKPEGAYLISAWQLDGNTLTCTDTIKDNVRTEGLRVIDSAINPAQEQICTISNNNHVRFFKVNKEKQKQRNYRDEVGSMKCVLR